MAVGKPQTTANLFDKPVRVPIDESAALIPGSPYGESKLYLERVLGWLENWLQCEYPDWKVYCTSVTEQWATVAINGPMARRLLGELTSDIPLDNDSFPFMSMPKSALPAALSGASSRRVEVPMRVKPEAGFSATFSGTGSFAAASVSCP